MQTFTAYSIHTELTDMCLLLYRLEHSQQHMETIVVSSHSGVSKYMFQCDLNMHNSARNCSVEQVLLDVLTMVLISTYFCDIYSLCKKSL